MYVIILTAGATLHAAGLTDVHTAEQAATALRPLAGPAASLPFTLGLVGTGMLGVPVLAGSGAYALAEAAAWRCGMDETPNTAPQFYGIIALSMVVGTALTFARVDAMRLLFWSAVVNGVLAPPCATTRTGGGSTRSAGRPRWRWALQRWPCSCRSSAEGRAHTRARSMRASPAAASAPRGCLSAVALSTPAPPVGGPRRTAPARGHPLGEPLGGSARAHGLDTPCVRRALAGHLPVQRRHDTRRAIPRVGRRGPARSPGPRRRTGHRRTARAGTSHADGSTAADSVSVASGLARATARNRRRFLDTELAIGHTMLNAAAVTGMPAVRARRVARARGSGARRDRLPARTRCAPRASDGRSDRVGRGSRPAQGATGRGGLSTERRSIATGRHAIRYAIRLTGHDRGVSTPLRCAPARPQRFERRDGPPHDERRADTDGPLDAELPAHAPGQAAADHQPPPRVPETAGARQRTIRQRDCNDRG